MNSFFSRTIQAWYENYRRVLPWRETKNPYTIWVSEIILQQTRIAQGLPYYQRFVHRFPTVFALAEAPQEEVLRLWQGLGYYSRAQRLHLCAKIIVDRYKGVFPSTFQQLIKLPGIGSYTAAAVASIAFDEPEAVVDGNVYRVLSRVFGIQIDPATREGKILFLQQAVRLLDVRRPGIYNQAVMEFGALQCTPKNPSCNTCILDTKCFANKHKLQSSLPYKSKKNKVRNRYFTYFFIEKRGKVGLRKREGKDIWAGLYDFYLVESNRLRKPEWIMAQDCFLRRIKKHIEITEISNMVKHKLSHQFISVRFVRIHLSHDFSSNSFFNAKKIRFYSSAEINLLPTPVPITRYLTKAGILKP